MGLASSSRGCWTSAASTAVPWLNFHTHSKASHCEMTIYQFCIALHFLSLDTLYSTLYTLHCTLLHFTLHSTHSILHFTLHTLHLTLHTLHLKRYFTVLTLHLALHSTLSLYTPQPTLYTLHFEVSTHYTLHIESSSHNHALPKIRNELQPRVATSMRLSPPCVSTCVPSTYL